MKISCLALVGLALIVEHPAAAQQGEGQQSMIPSRKSGSFGIMFSPILFAVQSDQRYFLPNDQPKFGFTTGFQYERLFGSRHLYGLRISLEASQRNGRYVFNRDTLRRHEGFVTIPLELVFRAPLNSSWDLTATIGGQYSQLVERKTYRFDKQSAMTTKQTDNWLYGVGGIIASFGFHQHGVKLDQQFGLRMQQDAGGFSKTATSSVAPFVQYSSYGLYYSVSIPSN